MRVLARNAVLPFVVAALSSNAANSADLPRPKGQNCGLRSPPQVAHRSQTHGVTFATHPHALPEGYTGCKLMWIDESNDLLSIAYFKFGVLQFGHAREPKGEPYSCYYESGGKLIAGRSSPVCPTAEEW